MQWAIEQVIGDTSYKSNINCVIDSKICHSITLYNKAKIPSNILVGLDDPSSDFFVLFFKSDF